MSEEMKKKKSAPRQDWKPHWIFRFLHWVWRSAFGAVKIAIGALATVAMIIGICMVVLAGSVGDYMEAEILANLETIKDRAGKAQVIAVLKAKELLGL
jgi:hypothetical protein